MIRTLAALLALLILSGCASRPKDAAPPPADAAALRAVSTGALQGARAQGAHLWRGIPFAAPPVGDLRWRAPRPPRPWTGVRDARAHAPWCVQVLSALDGAPRKRWGDLAGQEDCLTLDVYAPAMTAAEAASKALPVMVWIHGGANVWGRAEQYDGAALAARRGVVVVVIQYRLGPLGWFAHESLAAGGTLPEDASPNFGTMDTIRALEWVRDEIKVFGGDPGRVTVFGESAGGHNVAALLVSPRAKGLFHRAIVQSGTFRSTPLAEALGTEGSRPDSGRAVAAKLGAADGAALRALSVAELYAAYDTSRGGFDPPRVINDGLVLPVEPFMERLAAPGGWNAVPVMTGTNRDEMKLFAGLDPRLTRRAFFAFPVPRDRPFFEAVSGVPSRLWRAEAVDAAAQRIAAGAAAPVFAYRFDWDELGRVGPTDLSVLLGAAHAMEVPFVFAHWRLLGRFDRVAFNDRNAPARLALSDAMTSYWVNFAASGAPGRGVDGDLPEWRAWSNAPTADKLMVLDTPAGGGLRMIAEVETAETVARDLFADASLETDARRCEVFKIAAENNPDFAAAGAAEAARRCR